ncbi:Spc7 kinetochore protein-domain-containing protein [Kalaharituber pfeilii]|nr:Spc7 kinetochore protein-domain-containing protein [Kalaharituber pfeilii]
MNEATSNHKGGRKARSKSLGPGGLDALNSQNRAVDAGKGKKRRESMMSGPPKPPPKGILLPTVPISPQQATGATNTKSRRTSFLNVPGLNMPKTGPSNNDNGNKVSSNDGMTRSIPLRTEEEQAAREKQKKEILASRAERRKSLGNRRVSFATEATLHTFFLDDYPATPSSAGGSSRNSTPGQGKRRTNSGDDEIPESKKQARRRDDSSSSSSSDDENEAFSSSPLSADGLGRLVGPGEQQDIDSDSSSSVNENDSDEEKLILQKSNKKNEGFPNIAPVNIDEDDEVTMDLDDDVTLSAKNLKGFFKKPITVIRENSNVTAVGPAQPQKEAEPQVDDDAAMDMTRPLGRALAQCNAANKEDDDGEVDMDITRPVGGLFSKRSSGDKDKDNTSSIGGVISSLRNAAQQFQKHLKPRALFGGPSEDDGEGEATMDVTKPLGGLISKARARAWEDDDDGEGDMEITRPLGGLIKQKHSVQYPKLSSKFDDNTDGDVTMDMDITRSIGGLKHVVAYPSLPQPDAEDDGDMTVAMDMTYPVGKILDASNKKQTATKPQAALDDETMDFTVAIGGIKDASASHAWSSEEEDDGMGGEATMDFTAVVGAGVVETSPTQRTKRGRKGRRGSAIGAVVLQSSKEWEREQEAERQLQKEQSAKEAGEHPTDRDKGKQKATQDKDGDEDMDIGEDAEMEFTAIVPSVIQQQQPMPSTPTKTSTVTVSPKKAPQQQAMPQKNSQSTPVALFYGPEKPKAGESSISSLPSPAGGWIPPLKASVFGKPGSKRNTPTESVKMTEASAQAAVLESPLKSKKPSAITKASLRSNSPKRRVTRSSIGKARNSLESIALNTTPIGAARSAKNVEKEPAAAAAADTTKDTSEQGSGKLQTPSPLVSMETPTRAQGNSTDGPSISARHYLGRISNPSTPNANTPKRRLSGVGIDKLGLGSPAILATLDRRKSLSEASPVVFHAGAPKDKSLESIRLAAEEKREEKRQDEEKYHEQKRRMEKAKDETVNLRQRIENMTPSNNTRKRKSGDFEDDFGIKRDLFGTQTSERPGKRRSLGRDGPFTTGKELNTKAEGPTPATGRVTRSRASLEGDKAVKRAEAASKMSSPPPTASDPGSRQETESPAESEPAPSEPPAPLVTMQEFLEMTGISFLDDITHTKRRQTFVPGIRKAIPPSLSSLFKKEGSVEPQRKDDIDIDIDMDGTREHGLGDWIVAGAATASVYHLFWQSCHDLKKYISDGKDQMKLIEVGVNRENPPLFKEYIDSPADVKMIMNSQFKNIKNHSRLLAKQGWYDWRMAQLVNLNAQLKGNLDGLRKDEEMINKQKQIVEAALPPALSAKRVSEHRLAKLVDRRKEVEACDRKGLEEARKKLVELRKEVEMKRVLTQKKKMEAAKLDKGIEERKERMKQLKEEIDEAERVKEMNRGFSEDEVWALRSSVRAKELRYGWSIVAVDQGSIISMGYKKDLLLIFDAARKPSKTPEVQYIGGENHNALSVYPLLKVEAPNAPLVEQRYFLEILQKKISCMSSPRELIKFVSRFWNRAETIVNQIAKVRGRWITTCSYEPASDAKPKLILVVSVKVVLPELRTKVHVEFHVDGAVLPGDSEDDYDVLQYENMVDVLAKVIYSKGTKKVTEQALNGTIKGKMSTESVMGQGGNWKTAVEDVVKICFVEEQKKKQQQPKQVGASASAKGMTPRRTRTNAQTPGKKIPVRAAVESSVTTNEAITSAYATRSASKQSSSIPMPFEKIAAPFGTNKRGIPVPTKAAHEDR